MTSIRRTLLGWLLLTWIVVGIVTTGMAYIAARNEANRLFDYHLKQIALTVQDQPFQDEDILGTLAEEAEYDFLVQVWDESRVRLYSSHAQASLPQTSPPGFSTQRLQGVAWRVYLLSRDGLNVLIAQPSAVRENRAAGLALRAVAPMLLALPVITILIWITVNRGLAPIASLSSALRGRDHRSLTPIADIDVAVELRPMVGELNNLLARLREAIEIQRAFTADAAHELRTPLTALQLQAQLAERAQTEDERRQAFAQLRAGLKRAIHLVAQLLALARSEASALSRQRDPLDLAQLASQIVGEHAVLAEQRHIDLGVTSLAPAQIDGDNQSLRVLISNLIQNSLHHVPEGGRIDVSIGNDGSHAILEVTDTGPGIAVTERERVFDRFHRGEGELAAGTPGSGLGLAIVRNIASQHGAQVSLHDPETPPGLTVRVEFPLNSDALTRC